MKLAIILNILVLIMVSSVHARRVTPLYKCLGKEELKIHKGKVSGPVYKLNQELINELASASNLRLRSNYVQTVCNNRNFSPSVSFLRALLIYGHKLFKMNSKDPNSEQWTYDNSSITKILDRAPILLFQYLANLQSLTSYPKCLDRYIPELKMFIERFRYLEGDYSAKYLLSDKNKIKKLFSSLTKLDTYIKRCKQLKRKKDLEDLKPRRPL